MSLGLLSLVVIAALVHATWNLLSKKAAAAGPSFVFSYSLFGTFIYLPAVLWSLAVIQRPWTLAIFACLILSAGLHLGYSLALQRGYQVADLSVVYPIARGTAPMLSSLGAFLLLREFPSAYGLFGLFSIVVGIFLISSKNSSTTSGRSNKMNGARWGLATGALIAAYTVVDGYGVKILSVDPIVLEWSSNLIRFLMLAPSELYNRKSMFKTMKTHWSRAFLVGTLAPLSYILVLTAIHHGAPLSLAAPLREISMMVVAVFGMVLLREPITRSKIAGCLGLMLGVVLLGLA